MQAELAYKDWAKGKAVQIGMQLGYEIVQLANFGGGFPKYLC